MQFSTIETNVETMDYTYNIVGIDLGMRTLATLSNGLKIANLDTRHEEKMIKKYQKSISRKKIQQHPLQQNTKNTRKMDKKKKQPHKRRIPQIKPLPSQKIRPNLYGNTRHTRNVRTNRL